MSSSLHGPEPDGPAPLPPSPSLPQALRPAPGPREIALVVGLAFVIYLVLGFEAEVVFPGSRLGVVMVQALAFALPSLAAIRLFYLDRRVVLPFGVPAPRYVAAAVFGTIGLNHLMTLYGAWQERVWPQPESLRAYFDALLRADGGLDFTWLLLAIAIVPAVCEELLFRGFVQSGLVRQAVRPWTGVVATAVVFALFHLDPWRFLLVIPLGIFLGWLRETSGSLWPAILAHALNNTLTITFTSAGLVASDCAPGSAATALLAAVLVTLALCAGRRRPGRPADRML
ncbi:MAG TPA: type II CAAX endopeptidase family protein [Verrucomicrobiae bacterium]|nr:type II CAAX endopeptidase family protein [Verrucomicrobiae bacterium]